MKRIPAAALGLVLLTAACSGSPKPSHKASEQKQQAAPQVTIVPADGSRAVRPNTRIVIRADHGTLDQVAATSLGHPVDGESNADHTTWQAKWTLTPGASYQVTASATVPGGRSTTVTSSFQVASAGSGLRIIDVNPSAGQTVGVGMPIIVTFDRRVADKDKATLERSLEVRSTQPHEGAWNWAWDGQTEQAIFRLNGFWQAHEQVTFTAHLAGVKAGSGYAAKDVTHSFQIGDDHRISVDNKTHRLTAASNGQKVRSWGISLGTGGEVWNDGIDHLVTTSGIHLTMDKERIARMTPPGKTKKDLGWYEEDVHWATRITNSGEYIHQNTGDASCLGDHNCSHGCVRSPAGDAQWFFKWSYIGDVVTISGTSRKLLSSDGWGASYQVQWPDWVKGGAGIPITTSGSAT